MQTGNFRRGQLVWARVVFPHKWWPGLVSKADSLGVLVSFFDRHDPRYFLESEVCAFEDNFKLMVNSLGNNGSEAEEDLLGRALRLLGRRVALSLGCSCHGQFPIGAGKGQRRGRRLFRPDVVLGFVLSVAVSPAVEEDDFVEAVTAAAQLHMFRCYAVSQQKSVYGEASRECCDGVGANLNGSVSKLCSYSSSDKTMQFVTQGLDSVKHEGRCKESSVQVEKNSAACWTNGMNPGTIVSVESFKHLHKEQPDIRAGTQTKQQMGESVQEMLVNLRCLALDSFFLGFECLNNVQRYFLGFRNLSYQSISELWSSKHQSGSSETHFSETGDIETQSCFKVNKTRVGGEIVFASPSKGSHYYVRLKRKLDQPLDSELFFKMCRISPHLAVSEADAYSQISGTGCKSDFPDAFISRTPLSHSSFGLCNRMSCFSFTGGDGHHPQRNKNRCQAVLFDAFWSRPCEHYEVQNHHYVRSQSVTFMCNSDVMNLIQKMFNASLVKQISPGSNIFEIDVVQEHEKSVQFLNDSETCLSHVKMQEPEETASILKDNRACMSCDHDATEEITTGNQIDGVKVNCNCSLLPLSESRSNYVNGTHADNNEAGESGTATKKCPTQSYLSANQIKVPHSSCVNAASIKANREVTMGVGFGDGIEKNKKPYQPVDSNILIKSRVARQSAGTSSATSQSLFMKFPKDFRLPSKEELVKKFAPFGRPDPYRTKIFSFTGSAKVVFLHELDAVAAYQYVKRKSIFGRSNVLVWLDLFEHKRRRRDSPMAGRLDLNLRSCLKKSSPVGKDDTKSTRRVRFLMQS